MNEIAQATETSEPIAVVLGGVQISSRSGADDMAAKATRFFIRHPGEWYYDQLQIEAWIKGRSLSDEACNLLSAQLMQCEEYRNQMLDHLARKRGLSREELVDQILKGTAKPMSREEYLEVEDNSDEEL